MYYIWYIIVIILVFNYIIIVLFRLYIYKMTINGKSKQQIEEELRAPFPDDCLDYNDANKGQAYIKIEHIRERIDSVIGMLNYDIVVSDAKVVEISGTIHVTVRMMITVYDDDGNRVFTKSANGADSVEILKTGEKPRSFKGDVSAAESDAFKQIAKTLGVGINQLRKANSHKQPADIRPAATTAPTDRSGQKISVRLIGNFKDSGSMLKADAVELSSSRPVSVVIFSNRYGEIEKKCSLSAFKEKTTAGKCFSYTGYYKTFNNSEQAVFIGDLAPVPA